MQIVVVANKVLQNEFAVKGPSANVEVKYVKTLSEIEETPGVVFYLLDDEAISQDVKQLETLGCTVVINAVALTLKDLPEGFIRINAWPGFLNRPIIEVVAREQDAANAKTIFENLGWKHQLVPDLPGMISARIIAMIINEAYFTLNDQVSSKEEIDLAMKLGTNYPFGPFEWCEQIGKMKVVGLLKKLSVTDSRYEPAPNFTTH